MKTTYTRRRAQALVAQSYVKYMVRLLLATIIVQYGIVSGGMAGAIIHTLARHSDAASFMLPAHNAARRLNSRPLHMFG